MEFPQKLLVDTNVPITANLATGQEEIPVELLDCVYACVDAIDHVINHGGLVIDDGDEIFTEYRRNLSLSGQPGVGDKFVKWVNNARWTFPDQDRVEISKNGDSYDQFPDHEGLLDFDISDRKFVSVAYAHSDIAKPPILQATDSKWWGWKEALEEVGISVIFLCSNYIERKYNEKMGHE